MPLRIHYNARLFLSALLMLYGLIIFFESCQEREKDKIAEVKEPGYVGSSTCKSCHAQAYDDWTKSDHFLAMQPANDSTVLGDFNNTTFVADGVTNKFFKKEGKYYINTQGEDGQNHDFEILYAFGFFPLQQYLIAFPGGRLQSTRVSWDTLNKKWFHQYAGQKIHHQDWFHWTGNSQNWNTICASCHSTNLQKNYDFTTNTYNTTWSEINVSCESCHGPGGNHIEFVQSKKYQKGDRIKNSGLVYARDTTPQIQLNACAPCHARKSDISGTMIQSNVIMDNLIPQVISNEFYYPDGQILEEDYEYGSFTQSKMFHQWVQCSDCHNPHSGKLHKSGNELCLSCHTPNYSTPAHHFHPSGTPGSQCINCHMVARTYMGVDHRRDHSFRIPRPDQSVKYGTPNACTECHHHQTADWADKQIIEWYGPARKYHFSDDLIPGSLLNESSETHLLKLLRDTLQPEIARATAAFYLANIQTPSGADGLLRVLEDTKPLVRYHALRALENFPPEIWIQKAAMSLSDPVRAVRIAAADLYHRLPSESIPVSFKHSYVAANDENKEFLEYQTDFAVGNIMIADYELQTGNYVNAIGYYRRGLQKDSLMNYARLNLSAAYNSIGKNQEALQTLKDASLIDPLNDRIFYNLGLLYYELGDNGAALDHFLKATNLGSQNPGVYYNYGLLLQQEGKLKEAEQILLKGYRMDPQAANINYALAFFYLQQKLPQKARKHVELLYIIDPQNPDYFELFGILDQ